MAAVSDVRASWARSPDSQALAPLGGLTAARIEELGLSTHLAMSEQGAALEFAKLNEGRLAFNAEDRSWVAWTGTHWSDAQAATLAEMFYSEMVARVCERAAGGSDKEREFQIERARFLGKRGMRANVLALAQPALAVSRNAFDRDSEDFLNTPGGTVDLRSGELTPCDPARRLTQCTAVAFKADAAEPTRFVELAYYLAGEDAETFDWLLRALGYTVTGHVREDAAFFLRGPGGNGKSTLLKAVGAVIGDYAHPLDIKFLTAGADAGHSTDLAALRGKRLVVTSEVNKGQRLSTSRMKDLTGGDLHAYRDIRESAKRAPTFAPSLKLWLYGNHDLAIPGNDEGTWRRIVKIASTHVFPKSAVRDSIVASEGEGILRVLVEAAGRWYSQGLGAPPARVAAATAAYRREQDLLGKFFADCLVFEREGTVPKGSLNDAYQVWLTEEGGDLRVGPRELALRLAERDVTEGRTKTARVWKGVRLRKPGDQDG